MSQSIWTQCGAKSNFSLLSLVATRANASNFNQATLRLVSNLQEYEVLEGLIDGLKSRPDHHDFLREADHLHYVVRCAFRYPPLRFGSRFGAHDKPGIWYGSSDKLTALAETAYYHFRFLRSSEGLATENVQAVFAVYEVPIQTKAGVYLNHPPFQQITALSSKFSYLESQRLGAEMRIDGVEAIMFHSARWSGLNVAVFAPAAFVGEANPSSSEVWSCTATSSRVTFVRNFSSEAFEFELTAFLVDGEFPLVG